MKREFSEIVKDPQVLSGTLVFKGTRVPVENLFDYLKAGDSIDEFIEGFPTVSKKQILSVLKQIQEILREAA